MEHVMARKPVADPDFLARARALRDAEDAALTLIGRAQSLADAAVDKRDCALVALDAVITEAESELTRARASLVEAVGLDRAAVVLGMTPVALRKSVA